MTGIVVGIDGSECSAAALAWSMREAALRQWPVTAVLAWGYLDQHHVDTETTFDPHYTEADAGRALDRYIEAAIGTSARVQRTVVCDHAARALLDAAADAELLVVGARGLGGFKELLLGSVSRQCLHHSTGPIAVIHGGPPADQQPTMERIVVGIDGSEPATAALRWAVDEAVLRGADLEVVHAWHPPYVGGYAYSVAAYDPTPVRVAARELLDQAVDAVDTGGLERPVQRTLTSTGAAEAILTAAKGADLVVVGSRGLGGFQGLLLGSVSHQVAHHADCPVVVVPRPC